jgi:hypothetical protein
VFLSNLFFLIGNHNLFFFGRIIFIGHLLFVIKGKLEIIEAKRVRRVQLSHEVNYLQLNLPTIEKINKSTNCQQNASETHTGGQQMHWRHAHRWPTELSGAQQMRAKHNKCIGGQTKGYFLLPLRPSIDHYAQVWAKTLYEPLDWE